MKAAIAAARQKRLCMALHCSQKASEQATVATGGGASKPTSQSELMRSERWCQLELADGGRRRRRGRASTTDFDSRVGVPE